MLPVLDAALACAVDAPLDVLAGEQQLPGRGRDPLEGGVGSAGERVDEVHRVRHQVRQGQARQGGIEDAGEGRRFAHRHLPGRVAGFDAVDRLRIPPKPRRGHLPGKVGLRHAGLLTQHADVRRHLTVDVTAAGLVLGHDDTLSMFR